MNYLINTSLSIYERIYGLIRDLFVWMAERDLNELKRELDQLEGKRDKTLEDMDAHHFKRTERVYFGCKLRKSELKGQIERTELWINKK